MFKVLRKLPNGDFVAVDSCDVLEKAMRLVEGLQVNWPGQYVVREEKRDDVQQSR